MPSGIFGVLLSSPGKEGDGAEDSETTNNTAYNAAYYAA